MHKSNEREMEMEIYLPIHPFNPTQLINHTQKKKNSDQLKKKKEIEQIIIINNTRQKKKERM